WAGEAGVSGERFRGVFGVASDAKRPGSGAQSGHDALAPTRAEKETAMNPFATTETMEELDFRENDGIAVSLLWQRRSNRLSVVVADSRLGELFTVFARPHNANDVFAHPYAYAQPLLAA